MCEHRVRYNWGTTEKRERVGFLAPKRHQMKHLDFDLLIFGTRGSEVQILSPRPFLIFRPLKDQIEGLSVNWPYTYAVRIAVQKH